MPHSKGFAHRKDERTLKATTIGDVVDVGGGFPSWYPGMEPPALETYFEVIHHAFEALPERSNPPVRLECVTCHRGSSPRRLCGDRGIELVGPFGRKHVPCPFDHDQTRVGDAGCKFRMLRGRRPAILAADVVGYSRLMGRDESGTVARLRAMPLE